MVHVFSLTQISKAIFWNISKAKIDCKMENKQWNKNIQRLTFYKHLAYYQTLQSSQYATKVHPKIISAIEVVYLF